MDAILEKLNCFREEQNKIADKYEQIKCYSLVYLAKWSIIEFTVKTVGSYLKKIKLRELLLEWIDYLDGKGKKPEDIKDFKTDYTKSPIPDRKIIENIIPLIPQTYNVLYKTKNYRNIRNMIAHKGNCDIKKDETFIKHIDKLDKAIEELFDKLPEILQN